MRYGNSYPINKNAKRQNTINENEQLRLENEKLKHRLNLANDTIRDLEYACKNHNDEATRVFCSFIPRKHMKSKGTTKCRDDKSIFNVDEMSQASTVKMGSSKSCRKQTKLLLQNRYFQKKIKNDETSLLEDQEIRWHPPTWSSQQNIDLISNKRNDFSSERMMNNNQSRLGINERQDEHDHRPLSRKLNYLSQVGIDSASLSHMASKSGTKKAKNREAREAYSYPTFHSFNSDYTEDTEASTSYGNDFEGMFVSFDFDNGRSEI